MSASPEHGGKCRACEAIGACLRTQLRILFVGFAHTYFFILMFLLTLAPSDGFAATFPDKRGRLTICMPLFLLTLAPFVNLSVDTFPDKRGQLTFPVLFFLVKKSLYTVGKRNSSLPSFLSDGTHT